VRLGRALRLLRAHWWAAARDRGCGGAQTATTARKPASPPLPPPSLQGFDEYMNMVVDDAEEVSAKRGDRKRVGRILLKGDAITLMRPAGTAAKE